MKLQWIFDRRRSGEKNEFLNHLIEDLDELGKLGNFFFFDEHIQAS
jgi:hypothetical protein